MKLGPAYFYHVSPWQLVHMAMSQLMRTKVQPDATIFWFGEYLRGWTIMDRLSQICVPTLVLAGSYDFIYPPECQEALAAGIPGARLVLIDHAGHNPMDEKPAETFRALRDFLTARA